MAYIETINGLDLSTGAFVTPEMFGAVGDGVADDASAIEAAIEQATADGTWVQLNPGHTYRTTRGIAIGNIDFKMYSPIVYTGSGAAITVGSNTAPAYRHDYRFWVAGNHPYTADSVGVQMVNCTNCEVEVHIIADFETGFIGQGYNAGFGYNNVRVNFINNCMTAIALRSDGTSGWANENRFIGGRLVVDSNMSFRNQWTGILMDSDRAYSANANLFEKQSIEAAATCIHVKYGAFNVFDNIRTEAATLAFKDENASNWNQVYVSYGTTAAETVGAADFVDGYQFGAERLSKLVYDSGFIADRAASNANYMFAGRELAYMDSGGALMQVYKGVRYKDRIGIQSRNIGVMVDTTNAKRFMVTGTPYDNLGWRITIVCYDSDGNFIGTGVKSNSNKPLTMTTGAISGVTAWVTGSNATTETIFEVPDSCVKVFICFQGVAAICGFKVWSDKAASVYSLVSNGLTAIPTCEGTAGDFCPSAAADGTLGWKYSGSAWVAIS